MYDLARIDPVYIKNVHHFVEEAMRHVNREKRSDIFCPCVDCDKRGWRWQFSLSGWRCI
jgi:hypothetical protein